MKLFALTQIALLFFSGVAIAGSCDPVDLRPVLGPALDQGNTGHCYAHSSADLIAAATGRRVSPLDLATTYILASQEPLRNSRRPEVQEFLRSHSSFLTDWKKDRSDEPQNFTKEKILTDEGIYWTGGEEFQTIFLSNIYGLCDQARLPSGEKNYEQYLKTINSFHVNRMVNRDFSDGELIDPIGEVTEPEAKLAANSFQKWVRTRCGMGWMPGRLLVPETLRFAASLRQFEALQALATFAGVDTNGQLFEKIDELLNQGKIVSIGYSANDIMKRSKEFPSGEHASIIAARKEKDGQCLYFIRNSFGDYKDDYLARFKKSYEQGGVWVRSKDLPSIFSTVWIR